MQQEKLRAPTPHPLGLFALNFKISAFSLKQPKSNLISPRNYLTRLREQYLLLSWPLSYFIESASTQVYFSYIFEVGITNLVLNGSWDGWLSQTKNSKWVWSGNTKMTNRRQPCGTPRKSRSTITRHQEDKLSKATSSLFPIKVIAILERTQSNVQQNIEQLQTPTMGVTLNKKSTTTEPPP